MANFKTAMSWLREGKKIKMPNWLNGSYLELGNLFSERLIWADGTNAIIYLKQLEATDWEIFKEDLNLEDFQILVNCIKEELFSFYDNLVYHKSQYIDSIIKMKELIKEAGI